MTTALMMQGTTLIPARAITNGDPAAPPCPIVPSPGEPAISTALRSTEASFGRK